MADDIKNLYLRHIRDPNCVILVAAPASEDIATQPAYVIAREVDPKQERTLGIITKIDTVQKGDLADLPARLMGRGDNAWAFKLGAVAVRNRDSQELKDNITYEDVAAREGDFFESHETLGKLYASKSPCIGFNQLVSKLVQLQAERVRAGLPLIAEQVASRLAAVEEELAALPPPTGSATECRSIFQGLVFELAETINSLWCNNDAPLYRFACVKRAEEERELAVAKQREERAEIEAAHAVLTEHDASNLPPRSPPKPMPEPDCDVGALKRLRMHPRMQDAADAFGARVRNGAQKLFTVAYRRQIETALREARGKGLPDTFAGAVPEILMRPQVEGMRAPSREFIATAYDYMCDLISTLVSEHFGRYPQLSQAVVGALLTFMDESRALVSAKLDELLVLEEDPFTLNHYYADTVSKVRGWLVKAKAEGRLGRAAESNEIEVTDATADTFFDTVAMGGYSEQFVLSGACGTLNLDQSVEDFQVRIYCYRKVVHKRFCDSLAQYVRFAFLRRTKDGVVSYLTKQFLNDGGAAVAYDSDSDSSRDGSRLTHGGTSRPDALSRLQDLMAEPMSIHHHRASLGESLKRLRKAQRELQAHGIRPSRSASVATPAGTSAGTHGLPRH